MNQLPLLDIDATSTPGLPGLDATEPAAPAVNPHQPRTLALLDQVRKLVRDKTRFEPENIQAISETETPQDYTLLASYRLQARVESCVINGFFEHGAADRCCDDADEVEAAAQALSQPRLVLAANSMQSNLRALDTRYDEIQAGVYLPHAGKHWRLGTCAGCGNITCSQCGGSGKRGTAAWVDIYATPAHSLLLPEQADDDSRAILGDIVNRHDAHTVAALSQSLALGKITLDDPVLPQRLDARYKGKLRIVRLQASCNGAHHHLVAYGADLRWLRLDGIVEKLLLGDLQALGNALNHSADGSFFASGIDNLLPPLRDVAASALNGEVIESLLDGLAQHAHADVVSPQYAHQLRSCMLGALRHVHTRLAKQFWWKNTLAALAVSIAVFLFSGALPGVLAGLLAAGAGLPVFGRQVRGVLTGALGSRRQADRATAIARKGKRQRLAHALVLGPAIAAVLAAGHLLPDRGPFAPVKAATNIAR